MSNPEGRQPRFRRLRRSNAAKFATGTLAAVAAAYGASQMDREDGSDRAKSAKPTADLAKPLSEYDQDELFKDVPVGPEAEYGFGDGTKVTFTAMGKDGREFPIETHYVAKEDAFLVDTQRPDLERLSFYYEQGERQPSIVMELRREGNRFYVGPPVIDRPE